MALCALLLGCAGEHQYLPPTTHIATEQPREVFVSQARKSGKLPVVAVLAHNEGTEITDFLVPHALIKRSGVATVEAVGLRRGPALLMPRLISAMADMPQDLADFDQRHPAGADYVIVPAMHIDDDPVMSAWLNVQAGKGAGIVGICSGARVLGRAGLLDGMRPAIPS